MRAMAVQTSMARREVRFWQYSRLNLIAFIVFVVGGCAADDADIENKLCESAKE